MSQIVLQQSDKDGSQIELKVRFTLQRSYTRTEWRTSPEGRLLVAAKRAAAVQEAAMSEIMSNPDAYGLSPRRHVRAVRLPQ